MTRDHRCVDRIAGSRSAARCRMQRPRKALGPHGGANVDVAFVPTGTGSRWSRNRDTEILANVVAQTPEAKHWP